MGSIEAPFSTRMPQNEEENWMVSALQAAGSDSSRAYTMLGCGAMGPLTRIS
jgi:hypothetical protein